MLGKFNPSYILCDIYDIMLDREIRMGVYDKKLFNEIIDFLESKNVEYLACVTERDCDWQLTASIAFVEDGHPQLIVYDYEV